MAITADERIEAKITVASGLARRIPEHQIRKHLREQFAMAPSTIKRLFDEVRKEWRHKAKKTSEDLLSELLREVNEGIAIAFQRKDVRAVFKGVELKAQLAGLIGQGVSAPHPEEEHGDLARYWDDEEALDCIGVMGKAPEKLTAAERDEWTAIKAVRVHSKDKSALH